jgi:tetratricopeptide (TPR) repeat protein
MESGKSEIATKNFDNLVELPPEFAEAYSHRGIVHESEGRYDRAISDYTEAIKLNSEFEAAYANLGTVMSKLGDKKAACSDWKRLCKLGDCSYYEEAKREGDCE